MDILPLRQLAIRLASIHADDRAWVLAQLDPLEHERMDGLLMEIADLGLDKDSAVLAAMNSELVTRFAMDSVMPDDIALSTQISPLQHPYWRALSEQTVPPALITALASHVAVIGDSHVES